jgi:hypothetical protein
VLTGAALAEPGDRRARAAAITAGALGVIYAAVSAYWALGGTWLLNTVGSSLDHIARGDRAPALAGLWAVVLLKLVAAGLPTAAISLRFSGRQARILRRLATVEAVVLTLYGFVESIAGWLVQAGVLTPGRSADRRALAWHAFLWDPWFLVWGLLVCLSLWWSSATAS